MNLNTIFDLVADLGCKTATIVDAVSDILSEAYFLGMEESLVEAELAAFAAFLRDYTEAGEEFLPDPEPEPVDPDTNAFEAWYNHTYLALVPDAGEVPDILAWTRGRKGARL